MGKLTPYRPALRSALHVCALLLLACSAPAQTVTGTITGTVVDPSAHVIVGASATLTNERTGERRSASTNELGAFTFPALPPSEYSLKIETSGFKTFQRAGTVLSANERLALGDIQLTIGAVTETINVTAVGAAVQTTTADHSAMLSPDQMTSMLARGRD